MKVVKILWIDSCASNLNWTIAEDIDVKPMFIETFGVVVEENYEYIAVAQNHGDNPEQYCNIMTIPKGCIKEVFVIHEDNVCENEQNHAWSEEDDIMKQHCHQMLALLRPNSSELTKDIIDNCHHWLKSLKERCNWKPSDLPHWEKSTLPNDNTTGFNSDYFCHKGYNINYKELFEKLPKED